VLSLNQIKYGFVNRYYVKKRWEEPDPLSPPTEYQYVYDSACNCYQKRPKEASSTTTNTLTSFGEQGFEAPPDTDLQVKELWNFSIFQTYSLDPKLDTDYGRTFNYQGNIFIPEHARSRYSPVLFQASYYPTRYSSSSLSVDYSTEDSELVRASLSASLRDRHQRWAELSFVENADYLQRQVRLSVGWHDIYNRFHFEVDHYYDLRNYLGETGLKQQRYLVNYNAQCIGFVLEYSKFDFTSADDYEIRFALTLPNVGTFLDLKRGSSSLYQGNYFGGGRGTPF